MDTKALRQKVLDLAIRGKLVPQDPNDEPASVLLERIRQQKQQMVKEGKLKAKDIKNDTVIFVGEDSLHYEKLADGSVKCIEDEIPFELPKGWAWVRLASVVSLSSGKAIKVRQLSSDDSFPVYGGNGVNGTYPEFNVEAETIVIGRVGFYCGSVYKTTSQAWVTDNALICTIKKPSIFDLDFLVSLLKYLDLGRTSVSTAQPVVSGKGILPLIIPVPPMREQNEIKEAYYKIIPLIDIIEHNKDTVLQTVAAAKAKILDLAIRGQLVPQNPADEPASVLLERIRAEKEELIRQGKIKRDKKESVIFRGRDTAYYEKIGSEIRCIDSEIPFEIPDGWAYERLGNICSVARGGSPRPIDDYLTDDENGLNWIKIGDTEQGGKYIFSTKERIRPDGLTKTRYVHCGDFLLTNSMSFGRPYILKTDGCIHDGWLVIGDVETVFYQDFLYYMLSSSAMYNALSSLAVGSTVKNLKSDSVKSLIVPIPPIEEQKLIADQVEMYFAVAAQIEKSLN